MLDDEIIVRYVEAGRISKQEVHQLKKCGGAKKVEKVATSGELPTRVTKKLFKLLRLLQGSKKGKAGSEGMYGAIHKIEKKSGRYREISGGGANNTGKRR